MRVLGTPDELTSITGQHAVDLVVLALAPAYAEMSERLRERCGTLGLPALSASTFVEMHFAGLPVLPAGETAGVALGVADPGGAPSH